MWTNNRLEPGAIALMIAHPAHELLLYGWIEQQRPTIHILTTGASPTSPTTCDGTMKTLGFGFFVSTTFCLREFELAV